MRSEAGLNNADDILSLALELGRNMLECGGEVSRSEDTVGRICRAYGAKEAEVFSVLSFISGTIIMPDGTKYTQMRRIRFLRNNLHRLERLNTLSRHICKKVPSDKAFERLLAEAVKSEPYSGYFVHFGAVAAAFSITLYFGGRLADGFCSAFIGAFISLFEMYRPKSINRIIYTLIVSAFAGAVSHAMVMLSLGERLDSIMIGTIVLQLPGMAFGNAIRDLICDDIIAGSSRLIQAVLIAIAIALGFAAGLLLTGGIFYE